MSLLILAAAATALISPIRAGLQVNVDARDGDTIAGQRQFRVTVDSSGTIINQVEFYVGQDLRDTETSTPYVFPLDTVKEADGPVTLRFKAYTNTNKTAEKTLTLKIDNQKAQGADFHIKSGQALLSDGKYAEAIDQGRIALEIDPDTFGGRLVLARAYDGLKTFDKAQKYAEDAIAKKPDDPSGMLLLSGIDVHRAFTTFATGGGDKAGVLDSIGEALKTAVASSKKALDIDVDHYGTPSADKLLPASDAAIRAERYSLAIQWLQPSFEKDAKNVKVANRLAYAQLRSGKYQDALGTMQALKNFGMPDAYSDALSSVIFDRIGSSTESDAAMKAAIESDPDNLGVRTAQAFLALKRNKTAVLSGLATDLGRDEGQRPGVNYFLMALADRQQRFSDARKYFERGLLAEPSFPDLYIEQANYSLSLALTSKMPQSEKDRAFDAAKMYFQTALVARPEAVDALSGMAIVDLYQKNVKEAVRYGEAAKNAAPDNALGHYVASGAYQAAGRYADAQAEDKMAGKLDAPNLEGREIPTVIGMWRYLLAGGRIPVMSAP